MAVIMRGAGEDATDKFLTFLSEATKEPPRTWPRRSSRIRTWPIYEAPYSIWQAVVVVIVMEICTLLYLWVLGE